MKGCYVCTPEIALEALTIAAPFLSSMLSKVDDRTKPLLKALKDTTVVYFDENGTKKFGTADKKGCKITKAIRDQIAVKMNRTERTLRELLNHLCDSGYVSSDQAKPVTFELLYDVEEVEKKSLNVSAKLEFADVLMEEMRKETQNFEILGSEIGNLQQDTLIAPNGITPPTSEETLNQGKSIATSEPISDAQLDDSNVNITQNILNSKLNPEPPQIQTENLVTYGYKNIEGAEIICSECQEEYAEVNARTPFGWRNFCRSCFNEIQDQNPDAKWIEEKSAELITTTT
jgi:hypothetical protein